MRINPKRWVVPIALQHVIRSARIIKLQMTVWMVWMQPVSAYVCVCVWLCVSYLERLRKQVAKPQLCVCICYWLRCIWCSQQSAVMALHFIYVNKQLNWRWMCGFLHRLAASSNGCLHGRCRWNAIGVKFEFIVIRNVRLMLAHQLMADDANALSDTIIHSDFVVENRYDGSVFGFVLFRLWAVAINRS